MDTNKEIPLKCSLYKVEYYASYDANDKTIMYIAALSIDSALCKWKNIITNYQAVVTNISFLTNQLYLRGFNDTEI